MPKQAFILVAKRRARAQSQAMWNCCSGMIKPLLGKDLRLESEHWVQRESRVKPKPDPRRLLGKVNSTSRQVGNVAPLKGSYGKGGVHVPHVLGLTENSA